MNFGTLNCVNLLFLVFTIFAGDKHKTSRISMIYVNLQKKVVGKNQPPSSEKVSFQVIGARKHLSHDLLGLVGIAPSHMAT